MFVSNFGWDGSTCRGVCPIAMGGGGVGWFSGPCTKMLGGNVVDVCAVAKIRIAKTRHMMKADFDNAISPCDDAAIHGQELLATLRSLTNVRHTADKHNRYRLPFGWHLHDP